MNDKASVESVVYLCIGKTVSEGYLKSSKEEQEVFSKKFIFESLLLRWRFAKSTKLLLPKVVLNDVIKFEDEEDDVYCFVYKNKMICHGNSLEFKEMFYSLAGVVESIAADSEVLDIESLKEMGESTHEQLEALGFSEEADEVVCDIATLMSESE